MYSNLNLDEFLARYNNDYDEIWFKKKGSEDFISYNELIANFDLTICWVYEFGLDQLECLYIVFEEKYKEVKWTGLKDMQNVITAKTYKDLGY